MPNAKKMSAYAKGWKPPEQRKAEKKAGAPPKGKKAKC